jgi:6-phosphogluconolactonase
VHLPAAVPDVPSAFTETVRAAFAARMGPRFTVLLSGGPTAQLCYEHLASHAGAIDWGLVDLYMGDERLVPADDEDANQGLVRRALIDRLGPADGPRPTFTPMDTALSVDECVASYQRAMAGLLAGPGIDLIHLGLGADGHTASLFPGAPTLNAGPEELVASTIDPNGRNQHPRLTVTLPVINSARLAVFTVSGAGKAEAVASLRAGDDIPAARVASERVIWLMDDAAAASSP